MKLQSDVILKTRVLQGSLHTLTSEAVCSLPSALGSGLGAGRGVGESESLSVSAPPPLPG